MSQSDPESVFIADIVLKENSRAKYRHVYRMEPPFVGEDGNEHPMCIVMCACNHQTRGKWVQSLFPCDPVTWGVMRGGWAPLAQIEDDHEMSPDRVLRAVGYSVDPVSKEVVDYDRSG